VVEQKVEEVKQEDTPLQRNIKKLSQYPEATRFSIITKPRRQALPMSRKVVYIEMEAEAYGKGWARLKEISAEVIPPSKYAKAI